MDHMILIKNWKISGMAVLICLLACPVACRAEERLMTEIHISSTVSEGEYSLREIARIARKEGVDVVVYTDRDIMRWEYGVWPFRKVIKRRVTAPSVFEYGIERYLNGIEKVQKEFPDMVLVPGVESAPFYYWTGSPLKNNLKMYNWHKHILTIGLETKEDYLGLPSVGNPASLSSGFAPVKMWPVIMIAAGIFLFRFKHTVSSVLGVGYKSFHPKWARISGSLLVVLGLLAFADNWPFHGKKYDQYRDDLDERPYQDFIDYVNKKGGLTYWAHPEAEYICRSGNVDFETKSHEQDLMFTRDYTGYCIFYEGYSKLGNPGGIWDGLLKEYCGGNRQDPVWAIGGLSFAKGDLARAIRDLHMIVMADTKDRKSVVKALREGRSYVVRGPRGKSISLDEFSVIDTGSGSTAGIGEETIIEGRPVISIKGRLSSGEEELEIILIRDGKVLERFFKNSPFFIQYDDKSYIPPVKRGHKRYYRLEIRGKGILLVTNPVFVI